MPIVEVFGDDPRNGYFDGDHYYHPTLRFEMTFPTGWAHQDSRNSVAAGSKDRAAAMQLTLEKAAGTPTEYVNALGAKGSISGADGRPEPVWQSKELVNHVANSILWDGCLYGFDGSVGTNPPKGSLINDSRQPQPLKDVRVRFTLPSASVSGGSIRLRSIACPARNSNPGGRLK